MNTDRKLNLVLTNQKLGFGIPKEMVSPFKRFKNLHLERLEWASHTHRERPNREK